MLGFGSRKLMVGIDVGESSIKVIKLTPAKKGFQVESLYYRPLPPDYSGNDEDAQAMLKELIDNSGLKGENVSLSIPGQEAVVRYFSLPKMPREELRQAVFWEAGKHVSIPPEDIVLEYTPVGGGPESPTEQVEIMAVMVPRSIIDRWVRIFSRTGVRLRAVDIDAMALLAYYDLRDSWSSEGKTAMVDIGHSKTGIHIFQDRQLRFTRDISIGGRDFTQNLADVVQLGYDKAENLKIEHGIRGNGSPDDEEANKVRQILEQVAERIVVEIQRSFDYYQAQYRQEPVSGVRLTGGASQLPGLSEYFSESLGLEAVPERPWEAAALSPTLADQESIPEMGPFFAPCIGLATRGSG